ncbi:hypothetical protein [uncultured Anaerococcus sp.]|uniref:hypothetical protein n=1 Tax=uncultured Anaerococcus sp. TaxID=293428 RepID=UPI0025F19933|nr:hypothetical protein [uncultured Anaerococcus sp.]
MQIRKLERPDLAKVRPLLDLAIKEQDQASYPKFSSISDLYRELEYSIEFMATSTLLAIEDDEIKGLVTYFWDEDEKYIQTTLLIIKNKDPEVLEGLLEKIKKDHKAYPINIGLGEASWINKEKSFVEKAKIVEHSHVLEAKNLEKSSAITENIELLAKEDFAVYKDFHDSFAKGMYYSSPNLYRDFDRFRVFVKKDKGEITASLLVKIYGKNPCKGEIFGIFMKDPNKDICENLIKAMENFLIEEFGKIGEIKYFIEVEKELELEVAQANGFEKLDTYILYRA